MMQHSPSATSANIAKFTPCHKDYGVYLMPVSADLQFRLTFGILAVRSRLYFLQQQKSIPGVTVCVSPECAAVETSRHLFLDCIPSKQLWESIWADWRQFFNGALSCATLALPHSTTVRVRWHDSKRQVTILWSIIRSTALRVVWATRNRLIFEDNPAPPWTTTITAIYVAFAAHYRFVLRQQIIQLSRL